MASWHALRFVVCVVGANASSCVWGDKGLAGWRLREEAARYDVVRLIRGRRVPQGCSRRRGEARHCVHLVLRLHHRRRAPKHFGQDDRCEDTELRERLWRQEVRLVHAVCHDDGKLAGGVRCPRNVELHLNRVRGHEVERRGAGVGEGWQIDDASEFPLAPGWHLVSESHGRDDIRAPAESESRAR